MIKAFLLFVISFLLLPFNSLPVAAATASSFEVTSYTSFIAKLGYHTDSDAVTLPTSGVAFDVDATIKDKIDYLTEITITYKSCDFYSLFDHNVCWLLTDNQTKVLRHDEFTTYYYSFNTGSVDLKIDVQSNYPNIGLVSDLVTMTEATPSGSTVYVIPDSVQRSDVSDYDYYMMFNDDDVYDIVMIEIKYIDKVTATEETSTCIDGCELGDGLGSVEVDSSSLITALSFIISNIEYIIMAVALIAIVSLLNAFVGGLGAVVSLLGLLFRLLGQSIRLLAIGIKYLFIGLYKLIIFAFKVLTFPIWFVIWLKHRHDAKQLTREQLAMKKAREYQRFKKHYER